MPEQLLSTDPSAGLLAPPPADPYADPRRLAQGAVFGAPGGPLAPGHVVPAPTSRDPQAAWAKAATIGAPGVTPASRALDPQRAYAKAATIGAPGVGAHYVPNPDHLTTMDVLRSIIGGHERAPSVAAQDPFGILAWEKGGDLPGLVAGTAAPEGQNISKAALDEVRQLFPKMDKYGKPSGRLTAKMITRRLETAPGVSAEAQAVVADVLQQVGDRRVSAQEVHALAQGQTYTPDRIIRRVAAPVEGAKQRKGAPYGVTNSRQERGLRDRYLQRMERGAAGRDWYNEAGERIRFYANDDPMRATQLSEDLAATSPVTTVSANTGFGVKAYNQATADVPIAAGRFPGPMGKTIAAIHTAGPEGITGQKRTPFAQNLARGGDYLLSTDPARAVHDIWDAEAHGFMNADGSPMRAGFGPAQHRWMDAQQDKILALANERGVAGFTDWDELKSQAATWTAQQIEAGRLKPADAAKSYADYLAQLAAQGSRETVPGVSTGHLPELHQPGTDLERMILHDLVNGGSGIYDAKLRDQIAAGYGGLVGESFDGPGVFQGQPAPGRQTQVLTGSVDLPGGKGARVLDAGSRRILDASESTYGLLTGQDAAAYSRVLPAGSGQARNAWDVTLPGGTVTPTQMQAALTQLGPAARDMVLIPTPDGIRLAFMDDKTATRLTKALGGKVTTAGTFQSNLIENNWQTHRVGQNYFEAIRLMGTEKFDAFAPKMAAHLRDIDRRFAKETGGRFTLSPVLDEVRAAIAADGFAGLERLAKKFAIPVALLATGLAELQAKTSGTAPTTNDDAQ